MSIELFTAIGWYLVIVSPFVWRMFYNWYDEKNKDDVI